MILEIDLYSKIATLLAKHLYICSQKTSENNKS